MMTIRLSALVLLLTASSALAAVRVPASVEQAVRREFPDAQVRSVEREREGGVLIYEVNLIENGKRIEVEFAPDGTIGEIESVVDEDDVPPHTLAALKHRVGNGRITSIERHERRGEPRGGRFVPLEQPKVIYEAKYVQGSSRRAVGVRYEDNVKLPDAAAAAIAGNYGERAMQAAYARQRDGLPLFLVTVKNKDGVKEVLIDAAGQVVEVTQAVDTKDVPDLVRRTMIGRTPRGTRLSGVKRVERHATIADGKVAPAAESRQVYEVTLVRGEHQSRISVAGNGALVEQTQWRYVDDEEGDDYAENDDD